MAAAPTPTSSGAPPISYLNVAPPVTPLITNVVKEPMQTTASDLERIKAEMPLMQQVPPAVVNVTQANHAPTLDPAFVAQSTALKRTQRLQIEEKMKSREEERMLEFLRLDKEGYNVLHRAVIQGQGAIVQIYCRYKQLLDTADCHYMCASCGECGEKGKDKIGNTALHLAAMHGHETVCSMLLDAGANPSVTNKSGRHALHLAVRYKHIKVLELLLKKHAHLLEIEDHDGNTAYGLAELLKQEDFCKILEKSGAKAKQGSAETREGCRCPRCECTLQ